MLTTLSSRLPTVLLPTGFHLCNFLSVSGHSLLLCGLANLFLVILYNVLCLPTVILPTGFHLCNFLSACDHRLLLFGLAKPLPPCLCFSLDSSTNVPVVVLSMRSLVSTDRSLANKYCSSFKSNNNNGQHDLWMPEVQCNIYDNCLVIPY